MFATWLRKNKVPAFSYDKRIIPTAADRSFWDGLPENEKNAYISAAESYVGYEHPIIKATDFMEFFRSGNRIIMEGKHFPRRQALCALALGECIEHKGRFLDELVNVIFMICEETYWGGSAHMRQENNIPSGVKPNLDLFAGETGADLALVRYMLLPELTAHVPEIIERLDRELDARILTPFFTDYDLWWMGHEGKRVNNWCPWVISNVLTVLTYFEKDIKRINEGIKRCMDTLQLYVDDYPSDGGCDEGPSYWGQACCALFDCIEQIYNVSDGKVNFFGEPLLRSMLDYIEKVYIGGNRYVNFADSPANLSPIAAPITYRFAKAVGNENVARLSAKQYRESFLPAGVGRITQFRRLMMGLLCIADRLGEMDAPVLKTEFVLEKTEIITARENSEGGGFYFAAKGGHNGESHNHNDVGSFILYYDNEPVLIDIGSSDYTRQTFSHERYNQFFTRSDWHSVPTVNGICQHQSGDVSYTSSHFEYDIIPEKVYTSIGIESAYPKESGLKKLDRSLVLDRSASPSLTLSDSFDFEKDENEITENIILLRKPEIDGNNITLFSESGKAFNLTFDAKKFEAILVSHNIECSIKLKNSWGKDTTDIWKLEFKAKCGKNAKFEIEIKNQI